MIFMQKSTKTKTARGLKKGVRANSITAVFSRGPKRGNPTVTTSTITARRNVDPQHYVEGIMMYVFIYGPPLWQ